MPIKHGPVVRRAIEKAEAALTAAKAAIVASDEPTVTAKLAAARDLLTLTAKVTDAQKSADGAAADLAEQVPAV